MSFIRDAVIRLGVEMQQTTLQPPSYQPIIEQEKRLASIYKERASACVSAESTIRAEYQKTAAVLREVVSLERQRFGGGGGRMGGGMMQVGGNLMVGGTVGAGARGAPTANSYAPFIAGAVAGGGGGGWGGSSRFMGTYGNYSPSAPGPQFTGGNVAAGGSRQFGGTAAWFMGQYGSFNPMAPETSAAAGGGRGGRGPYDARNSAFNTGNAFWDRMRNRFGYGPFDAIGNQLRGWGGAVGMGVGMAAGSQFGDMGMIAGAATGQMAGQAAGYMATTGLGRQMLIRGAEAVATSGFGRGVAGGVAGAAALGGGKFLGAGVGYAAGAAALPFAGAAAVGAGGNWAVRGIANSFTEQWKQAHGQDAWNRNPGAQAGLLRSQVGFAGLDQAVSNAGFLFDQNRNAPAGFGLQGFAAADAVRQQRGLMLYGLDRSVYSGSISRRMQNAPEQVGSHLAAAEEGIRRRQAIVNNIGDEVGLRLQGLDLARGAEARVQSAVANVQQEKARIRSSEAAIGGIGSREEAEFRRITSAIQGGAKINVDDMSVLQSVAGSDTRVSDYLERERRRLFREKGFGDALDQAFGKGGTDLLEAQDAQDKAERERDKVNPDGKKIDELQKEFDDFLSTVTSLVKTHSEEIARLNRLTRQLQPNNAGG